MATVKKTPQGTSTVKKQAKKAPVTKKTAVKSKSKKVTSAKPKTLVGKVHHHIKRVLQAGSVKIFVLSAVLLVVAVGGVAVYQKFGAKAAVAAACVNVAPNAKVYSGTVTWSAGVTVSNGMLCATSTDKQSALVYQKDGNLVWYVKNKARWASNTDGAGSKLYLQADGNVVIKNKNNQTVYASSTGDPAFAPVKPTSWKNIDLNGGANGHYSVRHYVSHEPDANKVQRDGTSTLDYGLSSMGSEASCSDVGAFFWDIGREAAPGQFCVTAIQGPGKGAKFVFQKDGNLVFYNQNGAAIWSSKTGGQGTRIAFQKDGNVVVYDAANKAVWALSWGGGACSRQTIWNGNESFKPMDFIGRSKAYGSISIPVSTTMYISIGDALNPRITAAFQSNYPTCSR